MTTEPLDLDEVERRANAATPGPWRADVRCIDQLTDGGNGYPLDLYSDSKEVVTRGRDDDGGVNRPEDAEFIAHARTDVPALVAELRAARSRIAEVEAERDARPLRTMNQRCADFLADEVAVLVRRKVIDSRSPAGDALCDYRDPPSTPRADRLAEADARIIALEAQVAALTARCAATRTEVGDRDGELTVLRKVRRKLWEEVAALTAERDQAVRHNEMTRDAALKLDTALVERVNKLTEENARLTAERDAAQRKWTDALVWLDERRALHEREGRADFAMAFNSAITTMSAIKGRADPA